MNRTTVRISFCTTIILLLLFAIPVIAGQASITIKPGTLQDVLDAYSKATSRKTLYSNELIEGKNSPGTQNASPSDALQQILQGTSLTFQMVDNNTAVLKKKNSTEKQPISKQQENNTEKSGRQQAHMEMNLEEITVTAQKREENVQEVPISISVLDEFDIEDNDIKTISDIADYVPNFQQFSVGGAGMYTPSIRGLSAEVTATNSSSIGTYIDGVPYTNTRGNNMVLDDIESIEVLRGPQGTLYGKNAYAGAIVITTKKPDNETRGKISTTFGEDDKREYRANISGPIIQDKFYAGVSVRHYEKDGYIKNEYLNKWDDYREEDSYKLTLRTTPTDNLDILLVSTYLENDDGGLTMTPMTNDNAKKIYSDYQSYTKSTITTHALNVAFTYNDFNFTSVTTYKDYNDDRGNDFDYSSDSSRQFHTDNDGTYKTYSQEFRLNGELDRFRWLTGVYLERRDTDAQSVKNGILKGDHSTNTDSLGVFANGDYSILENLILMAGLRYDRDNLEIDDYLSASSNETSYSALSPKVGLKYSVNKNIMTYFTVSKGYKAGGFDTYEYDEETMWNYEFGIKTQSLDNRLTVNISVFYMDIDGMQVSSRDENGDTYLQNAATASSKGLEIETDYQLTDSLKLFANLGYAEAKFDEFKDYSGDYSGNDHPYAPKYNYAIGAKYRNHMGIYAQVDFNGRSSFYADKSNSYKNDGYTLANAKIGYEASNYDIYLYCKNITDKEYNMEGYYDYYILTSAPREIGATLTYRF